MPDLIALIPIDLERNRLGLPSLAAMPLGDLSVLAHTVARVARVPAVKRIVLVHPQGQNPREPLTLLSGLELDKPVSTFADPSGLRGPWQPMLIAARKWSLAAWRGGLGGATCYDELLPAAALAAALEQDGAAAALLVGGDWPLVDVEYCQRLAQRHLDQPEAMQVVFTQAPPGLCGIVVGSQTLRQLAENHGSFGSMLGYNPTRPQADPIGKDVCVQIDGAVRSCARRFICDTRRGAAFLEQIAERLDCALATATAAQIVAVATTLEDPTARGPAGLPQQVTIELTPHRSVSGPIVPQSHVDLARQAMPADAALALVRQLGAEGDVALTLGGLGDALLHEAWLAVVTAARAAGVLGICLETDLQVDRATLAQVLDAPIDVLSVRLNADTAAVYERATTGTPVNGEPANGFARVVENLQWLLTERNRRSAEALASTASSAATGGLPWIVPRLVKTADTLPDMETFFDRWLYFAGHAVIEPATTGCGLMPAQGPLVMAPPRQQPCRQLGRRMSILADGRVARCDQDWLGRGALGDAGSLPLPQLWQATQPLREAHAAGQWDEVELCASCQEWHRP